MEALITKKIFHYTNNEKGIVGKTAAGLPLSMQKGHEIFTYEELLGKVSALNFYNPSLQIFFRGQKQDYYNTNRNGSKVRSNLYPSLLRSLPLNRVKRKSAVVQRLHILEKAEKLLKEKLSIGYIHKHRFVRWAILQHYEVCQTPLLDISSSLQCALSFAISEGADEGFFYLYSVFLIKLDQLQYQSIQ